MTQVAARAHSGGFTLIEILVVLLVMGLLVSAVPIAFSRIVPTFEARSAARELAAVLREARSRAVRDNRETTLVVDTQAKAYSLDGDLQAALDPDLDVSMVAAQSERLGDAAAAIRFYPDGTATGGRITLERNHRAYHVIVDWLTGRVRLVEQNGNAR
ncbi:MAG: type II secretion system protein GspH [Alphaproteobacteria bacterium]|nr:MAG: type II secretion system protein GspH [Alphaproteobacteria bacterium]